MSVARQLPWFVIFGIAASATHVAVALSAARWLGMAPLTANTLAFVCALGVSYLGNAVVTFRVEPWRLRAFVKFVVLSLGVIGEYLGRTYTEVKGRPLYIVDKTFGFDAKEAAGGVRARGRRAPAPTASPAGR